MAAPVATLCGNDGDGSTNNNNVVVTLDVAISAGQTIIATFSSSEVELQSISGLKAGDSWTAGPSIDDGGVCGSSIWYCLNPVNSYSIGETFDMVMGATSNSVAGAIYKLDGVGTLAGQGEAIGSTSNAASVTSAASIPVDSVVIGCCFINDNSAHSASGWTEDWEIAFNSRRHSRYRQTTAGAGTVTLTVAHSGGSDNWAVTIAAFNYPSSGINGSASITLGAVTSTATGKVALAGTASKTLGAVTSTATGKVAIAGTASKTLGAVTLTASGTSSSAIAGEAAITLGAVTSTATGKVAIAGTASKTLGAVTATATGTVALRGTASPTLGAVTSTATGTVALRGSASPSLGAVTSTATGKVALVGSAANTLGAVSSTATGRVALAGTLSKTLGAVTATATGGMPAISGELSRTLGAVTSTATGALALRGTASNSFSAITVTATGSLLIAANVDITLGAITSVARGFSGELVLEEERTIIARAEVRSVTAAHIPRVISIGPEELP